MKLSDAIALGRTILAPYRGYILVPGMRGCALGMAGSAEGLELTFCTGRSQNSNYTMIESRWPWLRKEAASRCPVCKEQPDSYTDSVAHIFDNHVANLNPAWTLDQLIDWVKSVEPPEPAPAAEPVVAEAEVPREQKNCSIPALG